MTKWELRQNQNVDIYVPSLQRYFQAKILKIEDSSMIIKKINQENFDCDNNDYEKLPLEQGKLYLIYVGVEHNVYCGKTRLLDKEKDQEGNYTYILEKPKQLTPQERRRSSRIPYGESIYYRLSDSAEKEFNKEARAIDLSKGGMSLGVSEHHKPQTMLQLKLNFEDIDIYAQAKVKWIKEEEQEEENCHYTMGITFLELSPSV